MPTDSSHRLETSPIPRSPPRSQGHGQTRPPCETNSRKTSPWTAFKPYMPPRDPASRTPLQAMLEEAHYGLQSLSSPGET